MLRKAPPPPAETTSARSKGLEAGGDVTQVVIDSDARDPAHQQVDVVLAARIAVVRRGPRRQCQTSGITGQ
jgi:hypothetical protein